jgi:hypothetical protein
MDNFFRQNILYGGDGRNRENSDNQFQQAFGNLGTAGLPLHSYLQQQQQIQQQQQMLIQQQYQQYQQQQQQHAQGAARQGLADLIDAHGSSGSTGMAGRPGGCGLTVPGTAGSTQGPSAQNISIQPTLRSLQGGAQDNNWIGDMSGQGDPYAENGILGPWSATSAGLLGNMAIANQKKGKKVSRKPKDKPKRPLSAYNIFFKEERCNILDVIPESDSKDPKEGARKRKKLPHGKIGFESLAKTIGQRWKDLEPERLEYYKKKAETEMARYKKEMEEYTAKKGGKKGVDEDNIDDSGEEKVPGQLDCEPAGKRTRLEDDLQSTSSRS